MPGKVATAQTGKAGTAFPGRLSGPVGRHIAPGFANVELAGPADTLFRIGNHFFPLGDPADSTGQGKDAGEEVGWDAECGLDDAGIEIHVRIEFAGNKIIVFQRNTFDFQCDFKERVVMQPQLV